MKKLTVLMLSALYFVSIDVCAQMADGSTVPDFTGTDINGNSHTLYADYLDQGIPVVIDVSATWCGPCWSYHETHALKDLYNTYGPDASNEIAVLFVEGSASSTQADLEGTGSSTTGDWITGTPYPIIDDASIASTLQITYYPTVYGICPDGKIYEFGTKTATQLAGLFESKCNFTAAGTSDNAGISDNLNKVCISGESVTPSIEIKNFGTNNLTSATLELLEGDNSVETKDWSGNLSSLANETVEFSTINDVTSNTTYSVKIVTANGNTDSYTVGNEANIAVEIAPMETENTIKITIVTDNYPGETKWDLKDDNGNILKSFGPYQQGTGSGGSGGPDAMQTFEYFVAIPEGIKCYELNVYDSYGDGMGTSNIQSGYSISGHNVASGTDVINQLVKPNFGTSVKEIFALNSDGNSLSLSEQSKSDFTIFPNPTHDNAKLIFTNIMDSEKAELSIVNVLGEIVFEDDIDITKGNNEIPLDLIHLKSGLYTVNILSSSFNQSKNIIKID